MLDALSLLTADGLIRTSDCLSRKIDDKPFLETLSSDAVEFHKVTIIRI